jgi:SAM-dependent methyltransferase
MSTHALDAYEAFAPFYDEFTAHHRYEEWCADIEGLAIAAGLRGRRLLDVACGTGKSFLPFLARGYAVTACDVSPGMLALARAKAPAAVVLERHDMRSLPRLGEFDLVCILDDGVNYVDSEAELVLTLRGVAANLAPGGVVVFDANTLLAYRTFFAQAGLVRAGDDRVLVWDGQTAPDLDAGGLSEAELLAFVRDRDGDGAWRLARSVHRQRHHPRSAVLAALNAAGLGWTAVYGMKADGSIVPDFDETQNSKALYLARHEAPEERERR